MSSDLISTLERAGEFDALSKLRPGEPYFVLIGRDGSAPKLIDQWADSNRRRAVEDFETGRINREAYERECRKSTQAEMVACDMRAFKKGQPADVKEQPSAGPSYTGAVLPEEQRQRDRLHSARVRACAAVNNAEAELGELGELLPTSGLKGDIATLIIRMRQVAQDIAPRRLRIKA